jgi:hypothetical protein
MSKNTLALGSFAVGLLLGSLVFGSHTVTAAQSPAKPAPPILTPLMPCPSCEPTVPPITRQIDAMGLDGNGLAALTLDGTEYNGTTFASNTLEYAGGSYNLVNVKFSLPVRLQLKGAAANTVGLIALLEAVNAGAAPKPMPPNLPVLRTADHSHTVTVSFASPYGIK